MSTLTNEISTMGSSYPAIEINIKCDGWPAESVLLELTRSAILSAIKVAGLKFPSNAELSLLFCDDNEISTLNAQFRNIDQPTNVLSFPGADIGPGDMPDVLLGDLAFAMQTIKREALLEKLDFNHHLCHLIVHGFLHLFGYDHIRDEDARVMESLETSALALLAINDPYLEP